MKFITNMLDLWFKHKVQSKIKSNIDMLLMRIEMIKRRRNAMQKHLRSDIAELLRNGHDSNAYGRVGRLYLDQIRSLSYDYIDQFCTIISNHLTAMNDQSECPKECKEAVSSLVYAAARFGDLPELRILRSLFHDKYGDCLESLVNKEFVNLLKREPPNKYMKIQLMQEIALEHGVEWDPESLEHKLHKPRLSEHGWSQNGHGDQDQEYRITDHENGWMINIQEAQTLDNNDRTIVEINDNPKSEIEKQTEKMRQRLLDYWSRTTSLLSTSRETTTSSEESSTSSDDSTKSKPFFGFRLLPPPYLKPDPKKKGTNSDNLTTNKRKIDGNNENKNVTNYPNGEIGEIEKVVAETSVKSKWRRKGGGALTRVKSRRVEPLPELAGDGHVHPKLPDYDDIIARFKALRAIS